MLFPFLLIALFICQPSFAPTPPPSCHVAKKAKKQPPKRNPPPIKDTEEIQFLTLLNDAFQKNGLNVLSQEEIQDLSQKIPRYSQLSILKSSFAALIKRMIIKNPDVAPKKFQISPPNLPPFQRFLVQYTVPLVQIVQEKIHRGNKIDSEKVEYDLYGIIRKNASIRLINSTFRSLFPQEKIDFTEIRQLCQQRELTTPFFSWSPPEFVYAVIYDNNNAEGIRRIRNLPTKGSLCTRWIILSLKEVVGSGYFLTFFSKESVRYDTLHSVFSLLYQKESS
jgi:hypothetical protein